MSAAENKTGGFQIMATGQVESGDFGGVDNLYCKYSYLVGKDWRIIQVRWGAVFAVETKRGCCSSIGRSKHEGNNRRP